MKNLNELYDRLASSSMSVVAARVGDDLPSILSDAVLYFGLEKKRRVTIYTSDNAQWFQMHILAHLNGTSAYMIEKYLCPNVYNYGEAIVDEEKLRDDLKLLSHSDIFIEPLENTRDYVDFIIDQEMVNPSDVVIIYRIEPFFEDGNLSPKDVLDAFKVSLKASHVILVAYINRTADEKDGLDFDDIHHYREMKPYADEVILVHSRETCDSSTERTIVVEDRESSFEVNYDRETDQFIWR